jgi:hypothetical protein
MVPADAGGLWYVMLFPSPDETRTLVAALRPLATATGGEPTPTPHVTVGYFRGAAAPEAVVARARALTGPPVRVRAAGLFSWSEQPHPQFGYALSLRVRRDAALRGWQQAARAALAPAGLVPLFGRAALRPHMHVLRHLAVPPAEALRRVPDGRFPLAFTATRLLVSQQVDDEYVTWLEQPLPAPAGDAGHGGPR